MSHITIVEAAEADLPALAAIEHAAFSASLLHQRVFRNVDPQDHIAHSLENLRGCVGERPGARRLMTARRGNELLGLALWSASGGDAALPTKPLEGVPALPKFPVGTDEVLAAQLFGPVEGKPKTAHWCEVIRDGTRQRADA